MKVSELKAEMTSLFDAVDKRFEQVDKRFEELRREIKAEGETTRRHFDVLVEKIVGERNLALDRSMMTAQQVTRLAASNAEDHVRIERRLDDHEQRLEKIEQGRNTDLV